MKLFLEVMDLLVFDQRCISQALEARLSPEHVEARAIRSEQPCGKCWNCKENANNSEEARVSKSGIIATLSEAFNGKKATRNQIITLMKHKSDKIWAGYGTDKKPTNDECDRLLLELMIAGIVHYAFEKQAKNGSNDYKRYGIGDGMKEDRQLQLKWNRDNYLDSHAWAKIPRLIRDYDLGVESQY